jgi:peptide/nickel transport system permease protein
VIRFIIRRVIDTIPVVLLVTALVFSLTEVFGGDPIQALVGDDQVILTKEMEAALRERLGLNDPLPVRYLNWLGDAARGNLGESNLTRTEVSGELLRRLPATAQLAAVAWLFAIAVSIPLGVISAIKRNTWVDHVATVFALGGVSMPSFWMGLLLILTVSVWLNLLPPSGFVNVWDDPVQAARHLALPGLTLGVNLVGTITRQTRAGMLDVLGQDYIRTARAKGLRERTVIYRHALRNSLLSVVTVLGLQFATLLGGTVIIEQVFAVPGIGRLAVNAVFSKDLPVIQGVILLAATGTLIGNLWADIMYSVLDPRIRFQ